MCDEILDYLFSKDGVYSKSYILGVVALLISSAMSEMYSYNTALAKWLALTNPDVELTTKIVIILSVAGALFALASGVRIWGAYYQYDFRPFGIMSLSSLSKRIL